MLAFALGNGQRRLQGAKIPHRYAQIVHRSLSDNSLDLNLEAAVTTVVLYWHENLATRVTWQHRFGQLR
nr:hypothetical protein CFP56_01014 [Quercus suber]